VLGSASDDTARLGGLLVQVVILFYGCELFMRMSRNGSHVLSAAAALSVLLIALRTAA
jgi:ABC-type arginine/histidine transport system permease subunit